MQKEITHQDQQRIWDEEHQNPTVLLQMDSKDASSGVTKFFNWLQENSQYKIQRVVELGCGKGRNVIWLTTKGLGEVSGIDFSPAAIKEAQRRAEESGVSDKTDFRVQDAIKRWPYKDGEFDLVIDCFATTDIESKIGRKAAVKEMKRVLRSKGLALVYVMSSEDEYHAEMIKKSPAHEKNSFLQPTGKYEKVYDRDELLDLYSGFDILLEERVSKIATFSGKDYKCNHYWLILQNP